MYTIYSKLPTVIINYILCFHPQFIMRKGKLTSTFSKEDERYKMLKYIIVKPLENPKKHYSYLGITYVSDKRFF